MNPFKFFTIVFSLMMIGLSFITDDGSPWFFVLAISFALLMEDGNYRGKHIKERK